MRDPGVKHCLACATNLLSAARTAPKALRRLVATRNSWHAAAANRNSISPSIIVHSKCPINVFRRLWSLGFYLGSIFRIFTNHLHLLRRACQKEDWRKHKKHCGKTKVSKNLPGTARDPFWAHPDVPDHSRNVSIQDGVVDISSIGFAKPDPAYPHSPALQRQVSLLTGDKHADYFLFDETDRPIRFIVNDMWMRMTFRSLRADLLSGSYEGLAAIAEYIIKVMAQKPGLSRERILGQLQREYGVDLSTKVAEWEEKAAKNGFEGSTFLEVQSRSTMAMTMAMTHT